MVIRCRNDAHAIYQVPIYSTELGGRADLVLDTKPATLAFSVMAATFDSTPEFQDGLIPVVYCTDRQETDDGWVPEFTIEQWVPRADNVYGRRLIDPPARNGRSAHKSRAKKAA